MNKIPAFPVNDYSLIHVEFLILQKETILLKTYNDKFAVQNFSINFYHWALGLVSRAFGCYRFNS